MIIEETNQRAVLTALNQPVKTINNAITTTASTSDIIGHMSTIDGYPLDVGKSRRRRRHRSLPTDLSIPPVVDSAEMTHTFILHMPSYGAVAEFQKSISNNKNVPSPLTKDSRGSKIR